MGKRVSWVWGFLAVFFMFGSAAYAAPMTDQALWPSDSGQYDFVVSDWTAMTWGLPGPVTVPVGNYTVTATGTGTADDPYRFEVSPEVNIIPDGSLPNFSRSYLWQNILELRDWISTQPRAQVPEPSMLAMLLLGLAGVSAYRRRSKK
jgi:hypothetical protein